jgi:hypothetical protein
MNRRTLIVGLLREPARSACAINARFSDNVAYRIAPASCPAGLRPVNTFENAPLRPPFTLVCRCFCSAFRELIWGRTSPTDFCNYCDVRALPRGRAHSDSLEGDRNPPPLRTITRMHFYTHVRQCISAPTFAHVFPHEPDRPPSTPIMSERTLTFGEARRPRKSLLPPVPPRY